MRTFAQYLVGTMGAMVFGVTTWHALNSPMPDYLGHVAAGTAITLGAVFTVCVALEPRLNPEGEQ